MSKQKPKYVYQKYYYEQLDENFIKQWDQLIENAIDPIVYLDANFVLSAEPHLGPSKVYIRAVFCVEQQQKKLVGLALFTFCWGNKRLPFPHLLAYKTKHSFLTGLLIDKDEASNIVKILFKNIAKEFWYCAGMRFVDFPVQDSLAKTIKKQSDIRWFEFWGYERAIYKIPDKNETDQWSNSISKKRLKNYRKSYKDLETLGDISWEYLSSKKIDQSVIDNYLYLEDTGWKGEHRSSLLAKKNEEAFFNALIKSFQKNEKVFFTELRVGDKLVAATCNLQQNNKAFAFKIGWDNEYKKYSPGIINEIEFLKYANQSNCDFKIIESGATEDSFINSYWKDRWYLAEGIYTFNQLGNTLNSLNNLLRKSLKKIVFKIKKMIRS